jgi:hypothetical protein
MCHRHSPEGIPMELWKNTGNYNIPTFHYSNIPCLRLLRQAGNTPLFLNIDIMKDDIINE